MFGDNATGRLRTILSAMREYPGGRPLRRAWSATLGVQDGGNATLLPVVARVVTLPDQARSEILALSEQDTDGLLAWYDRVQVAMSIAHHFDTTVDNFKAQFRDEDLVILRQASFQVNKAAPDAPLAPEEVASATELVNGLLTAIVDDPDLDDASRALLVRAATGILNALMEVRVTGTEGVRDALGAAFAMFRLVSEHAPSEASGRRPGALAAFERAAHDLASLTTIATGMAMSAPAVQAAWHATVRLLGS
ncbi:hypothetical protein [Actinotalea sp. JY-7885]|uniref:hypothetical protein n=1 Tax=Actinotalea sp. JY-7885 TaxID=2758576 RepID=UPI00165EADFA|nr:hypothetical protein [Actinotalea sp. JY-7885]